MERLKLLRAAAKKTQNIPFFVLVQKSNMCYNIFCQTWVFVTFSEIRWHKMQPEIKLSILQAINIKR